MNAAIVQGGTDLIERDPIPHELDFGRIGSLVDSGDAYHLATRSLYCDHAVVRQGGRNEGADGIDSQRGKHDVPARWWADSIRTVLFIANNPSSTLQHHRVGR